MSWLTEPDGDWDDEERAPRSHLKLIAFILAGWLVVSLVVLMGLILFKSPKPAEQKASNKPAAGSATVSPAKTPAPLPDGWVRQAADDQTNCAGHSYGRVQSFFGKTPCTSVHRVLATTKQAGRPVIIASNVVTFATAAQAQRYLALVDSDGTGNIDDLLREGASVAGVAKKLPEAAFASRQDGARVWVAEAAYTDGKSYNGDVTLKDIAQKAIGPS